MLRAVLGTNDCDLGCIALTEQKRLSAPKELWGRAERGATVSWGGIRENSQKELTVEQGRDRRAGWGPCGDETTGASPWHRQGVPAVGPASLGLPVCSPKPSTSQTRVIHIDPEHVRRVHRESCSYLFHIFL